MTRVKLTLTSVKSYNIEEQDLDWYLERGAVNADMVALVEKGSLEEGSLSWDDIDDVNGASEDTYEVVLIDSDDNEVPVNTYNVVRDTKLFPLGDDEKPIADDLNAGSTVQPTSADTIRHTGSIY